MKLKLYHDDFREVPRRSESSEKVVRYWFDGRVVYDVETTVTDEDCLGIIAERIVLRRLLGIDGDEKKHVPYVLDAKPFGVDGPKCAELLLSDVFVAMAFVPLTPPDSRGRPILARLYCVSGLSRRYFPSSLRAEAVSDGNGNRYSWFLTGLPDEKLAEAIDGRSWLLAAELLMYVVTKRDVATARNLATKYIVTGDVQGVAIAKVDIGRKGELALRHGYKDFKWIIPKENDMDNVPKRKIEKPATLDEAYKLIESMQSVATQAMFSFIRHADLNSARVQYVKNGADIFAFETASGMSTLEVVADQIRLDELDANLSPNLKSKRYIELQSIEMWLKEEGADCARMYFLLAQTAEEALIRGLTDRFPINAVDENGLTAVDWALNCGAWEIAYKLHRCGGKVNQRVGANCKLEEAIGELLRGMDSVKDTQGCVGSKESRELLLCALDVGCSPARKVNGEVVLFNGERWPKWDRGMVSTTIWGVALESLDVELIEACLKNGADQDTPFMLHFNEGDENESSRGYGRSAIEYLESRMEDYDGRDKISDETFRCARLEEMRRSITLILKLLRKSGVDFANSKLSLHSFVGKYQS